GVDDHHDHSVFAVVSGGVLYVAVRQAAPDNAAPVTERARYVERLILSKLQSATRIRPARMRAERAARPAEITVITVVVKGHQLHAEFHIPRLLMGRRRLGPHLYL